MRRFVFIFAIFFAAIAVQLYQLAPKYPPGFEDVSFKRQLFRACFRGLFRTAVWAERFGLIAESADLVQPLFFLLAKEPPPLEGVELERRTIAELPVLIFRPTSTKDVVSKAVIYFHGGGFAIGSTLSHYSWTLRLANATDSVVISVEYPLAPKYPFPRAIDDCIRVTKTIFDSASALGIDRNRIAVAGDSAGGNLAAVVALDLAANDKYPLKAQILLSPALLAAGVSLLPSYVHYHELFMISLSWFIVKYAGCPFTKSVEAAITSEHHVSAADLQRIQRYLNMSALPEDLLALIPDRHTAPTRSSEDFVIVSPSEEIVKVGRLALTQHAWPLIFEDDTQLSRVAPAFIQNCEFDAFRDEALLYFNRLRSLGVVTSLSFLPKAIHAEPLIKEITGAPPSAASLKGLGDVSKFIKEHL